MGNNCQIRKVHKESSINYSFHAEKYVHGFVSFGRSRFYIFTLELHHQFKLKLKHFIGQPWKAALPKYKHITNTHIDTIRKWNESKQNEQKPWYQARRESHTYVSVMHATCTVAVLQYLCHINVPLREQEYIEFMNQQSWHYNYQKETHHICMLYVMGYVHT